MSRLSMDMFERRLGEVLGRLDAKDQVIIKPDRNSPYSVQFAAGPTSQLGTHRGVVTVRAEAGVPSESDPTMAPTAQRYERAGTNRGSRREAEPRAAAEDMCVRLWDVFGAVPASVRIDIRVAEPFVPSHGHPLQSGAPHGVPVDTTGAFDKLVRRIAHAEDRLGDANDKLYHLGELYGFQTYGLTSPDPAERRAAEDMLYLAGPTPEDEEQFEQARTDFGAYRTERARLIEQASLWVGEQMLRQGGYQQIAGSSEDATGLGEAHLIGFDGTSLAIMEAPGRYLRPGADRDPDGETYVRDLLDRDRRFQRALPVWQAGDETLGELYGGRRLEIRSTLVEVSVRRDAGVTVTETPLVTLPPAGPPASGESGAPGPVGPHRGTWRDPGPPRADPGSRRPQPPVPYPGSRQPAGPPR